MNPTPPTTPNWSTATFSEFNDTWPMELAVLEDHLHLCRSLRGSLFVVRCQIESTQAWVLSRVVTTLAVVAMVLIAVNLLIL